jgi:hypothetical protein
VILGKPNRSIVQLDGGRCWEQEYWRLIAKTKAAAGASGQRLSCLGLWRRSSAYGVNVAKARTETGKVAVRQPAQNLAGDAAFITFGAGATFVPAIRRDLVMGAPYAARIVIADLR